MPRLKLDTSINRPFTILFRLSIFRARARAKEKIWLQVIRSDRFFRKTGNNSQPVAHTLYRFPTRGGRREKERERETGRRKEKKKGLERRDGTEGKREERETK